MLLVYILAAIGLIGLAWRLAQVGQAGRSTPAPRAGGPQTIESLLASGNKIGAIKLLREQTGLGLAEAKAAIDAHRGGAPLPGDPPPTLVAPDPATVATDPLLRDFLNAGNLIAAIKRYRELTGLGLKESKEAVERLGNGR